MTIDNSVPDSDKCELYGPEGKIGDIENTYGFYRVRLNIKREKLEGYYFVFTDADGVKHTIKIDKNGRVSWPKGFFDAFEAFYFEMF